MRTLHENPAAAGLFALVVSGPLREVEALPGGGWIVTPQTGAPLVLPGDEEAAAYIHNATHGTGPAALAPAALSLAPAAPAADEDEVAGCGCVRAVRVDRPERAADLMQARQISACLQDFEVSASRRSVVFDEQAQAAVVRVASDHGLYALHIPPVHARFTVYRNAVRDGQLEARRVPGTRDSLIATLFATYLRGRAAL
ncbi:hypothetical protein ACFYUJ_39015 [Streptomyces sp. NPDC004520]|uniref:hypothetical protein n=1 Tax=Streptomyces sp. NPDC004520 TaxID=3364702 RepID=UPI0036B272B4